MALNKEGREIMDSVRGALAPTESDRARIRESLAVRVAAVAATSSAASWYSSIASALGSKAGVLGVVACLAIGSAGSVGYLRARNPPRPTPTIDRSGSSEVAKEARSTELPPVPATEQPSIEPSGDPRQGELPGSSSPAVANRAGKAAPAVTERAPDRAPDVEGEIALLAEAQRALSAGKPERALELLEEHARTFPRGTLAEERTAARIIALCKLGRVAKARGEAAAFLKRLPDSPLAERVRAACGDAVAPFGP